jgi:C1A family cysteine protease
VWAWSADDVFNFILSGRGGVVIGVNWYQGMLVPDRAGCIKPTGRWIGGHAVYLPGATKIQARARVLNSWGLDWADKGRAWLAYEDLERLLREDGEACAAVETRVTT